MWVGGRADGWVTKKVCGEEEAAAKEALRAAWEAAL